MTVSVDEPADTAALRTLLGTTFTMVCDPGRDTARAFGVYDPANDIAWPSIFLLDRDGTVRWSYVEPTYPVRLPIDELLKHVNARE